MFTPTLQALHAFLLKSRLFNNTQIQVIGRCILVLAISTFVSHLLLYSEYVGLFARPCLHHYVFCKLVCYSSVLLRGGVLVAFFIPLTFNKALCLYCFHVSYRKSASDVSMFVVHIYVCNKHPLPVFNLTRCLSCLVKTSLQQVCSKLQCINIIFYAQPKKWFMH